MTSDETVRELNRQYRGLDEVTDVLSFSSIHSGHWEGENPVDPEAEDVLTGAYFAYPPGELAPLGEVVISFPQAQRQALERNEPMDREMALLIIHGILHLVGHDHAEVLAETAMKAKEQAALKVIPRLEMPQSSAASKSDGQPRTVRK